MASLGYFYNVWEHITRIIEHLFTEYAKDFIRRASILSNVQIWTPYRRACSSAETWSCVSPCHMWWEVTLTGSCNFQDDPNGSVTCHHFGPYSVGCIHACFHVLRNNDSTYTQRCNFSCPRAWPRFSSWRVHPGQRVRWQPDRSGWWKLLVQSILLRSFHLSVKSRSWWTDAAPRRRAHRIRFSTLFTYQSRWIMMYA